MGVIFFVSTKTKDLLLKNKTLLSDEKLIETFLQFTIATTKYGGKSMYQYSFSKEKEKEILDNLNASSDSSSQTLEDKLKSIDSKYSLNADNEEISSSLNLEKLDKVSIDEDAIKTEAQKYADKEKESNVLKLEEDTKNKAEALEASKQNKIDSTEESKKYIENLYSARKEEASNEALKRGLGRSSIIINQIEAFDKGKIDEYIALDKELTDSINDISDKLNNLNVEKESALKNYDIAYAVSVDEQIKKLTEELTKKQQDVIKYNNEIAEKEAKYNDSLVEKNNEVKNKNLDNSLNIAKYIEEYGVAGLNQLKLSEKYDTVMEYLNGLSKEDALSDIQSKADFYKDQLGDKYYQILALLNKR